MKNTTTLHTGTINQNVKRDIILQLTKSLHSSNKFSRHPGGFCPLRFASGRVVVINLAIRSLSRLPWTTCSGLRRGGRLLLLSVATIRLRLLSIGSSLGHAVSLLRSSVVTLLLGLLVSAVASLLLVTAISAAAAAATAATITTLLLIFCRKERRRKSEMQRELARY